MQANCGTCFAISLGLIVDGPILRTIIEELLENVPPFEETGFYIGRVTTNGLAQCSQATPFLVKNTHYKRQVERPFWPMPSTKLGHGARMSILEHSMSVDLYDEFLER